jgi:MFS family permease
MVLNLSNRMLFVAIFISGASALIYQLIWVRLLGLVFGVSSFAVATVVAVFLLGLAFGSYIFGRWSERTRDPLRIYLYVDRDCRDIAHRLPRDREPAGLPIPL